MSLGRLLRGLTVLGAVLIATTITIRAVRAQEDDPSDAKTTKTSISSKGSVAIAGTPCPSPTAGLECYSITGSALKNGKTSSTLTGTLEVSTKTSTSKGATCYTVLGSSTETLTLETTPAKVTKMDVGPGSACIKTNTKKKTSSETVSPAMPWTSATGSAEKGSGKESWKVTPTDASSTTSPLAGSGTISITGSVSP